MKLRNMTRCAIFSAVLAVCAWLSIPLGDQAISLQSFGVFLTLFLLGGRDGTVSVLVYLWRKWGWLCALIHLCGLLTALLTVRALCGLICGL